MMKKFYYKKEETVDKTPIILERRNTLSKDGNKEEAEKRLSSRTSSLGNVDQLKDSLNPRIRSREITKCLSEDVLSRSYGKNPGKVITERELAASRLYKTRKASINSKDSPQKVPQKNDSSPVTLKDPKSKPVPVAHKDRHKTDTSCLFPQQVAQKNDLSPVTLKDPKFKPVPVPPKDRRSRESCLCYLVIFMGISLCTIGVLAGVTGLLYSEIFSNKNSTSHRLKESMIDITNLIQNNSSIHEYRILNNETFARKVSFESADYDSSEIRRSGSNRIESENNNAVQFRQMHMADLNKLLDSKKAEIKFQDRDTTIFELNTSSSAEQEDHVKNMEVVKEDANDAEIVMISETDGPISLNTEHVSDDQSTIKNEKLEETKSLLIFDEAQQREKGDAITSMKQEVSDPATYIDHTRAHYINDNIQEIEVPKLDSKKEEIDGSRTSDTIKPETDALKNKHLENGSSKNINWEYSEVVDKKIEVEEENIEYTAGLFNSQFNTLKDSSDLDLNLDLDLSDKKSNDGRDNHSNSLISGTKLENQPVTFMKNTDIVTMADKNIKNISQSNLKLNDINLEYKTATVLLPKDQVIWKAGDPIKVSNVDNEPKLVFKKGSSENLTANANSEIEHDVETMLEVINEPEDNIQDPFDINRRGDIDVSGTSSMEPKHDLNLPNVKNEDGSSFVPLQTESQISQKDQMPQETLRIKPLSMKVSLAEAMKHLQILDVNNKLLTSRMKSSKPKAPRQKPTNLSNKQRKKENVDVDRMQYLHKLKLALQENLIGL